jgi:hypothetical protein
VFVPSLADTLTREETSVVNVRTPANGALVAGVKEGPEEIVKAMASLETMKNATDTVNNMSLRTKRSEFVTIMKEWVVCLFTGCPMRGLPNLQEQTILVRSGYSNSVKVEFSHVIESRRGPGSKLFHTRKLAP